MKRLLLSISLGAAALMGAAPLAAQSVTVNVPGGANPFLAGQPNGTACCSGDSAPLQSPVLISAFSGGQVLTFTAVGGSSNVGGVPTSGPDGNTSGTTYSSRFNMNGNYTTGISGAQNVNLNALMGVFLGAGTPTGTGPASLDFTGSGGSTGLDFLSLAPGLNQIFWIGDGLTGIGTGAVQRFTVPTGATRLYLGTSDGFEWNNNSGVITATVTALVSGVPEPSTWAMMLVGFGAAGFALRRRRAEPVRLAA